MGVHVEPEWVFMMGRNMHPGYSGVWQDTEGKLYSIHTSDNTIVVAQLDKQNVTLAPHQQGSLYFTGLVLDLALNGDGFFVLELENGSYAYTRHGRFYITSDALIVNVRGERLVTENNNAIPNGLLTNFIDQCDTQVAANLAQTSECLLSKMQEKEELIVASNGVLSLRATETGDTVEYDQIVLATIHPAHLTATENDHVFGVENSVSVAYFFPDSIIQQGALEGLKFNSQRWTAFTGALTGNTAILTSLPVAEDTTNDASVAKKI